MAEGKKKRSQGKECSFFGCSNRMYDANGKKTRFRFFTFPKDEKLRRIWENRVARKSGKDGFRITKATVVCNVHFRTDDILRVPGESRLDLRKGAVPLKWNERPKEKEKKKNSSTTTQTTRNITERNQVTAKKLEPGSLSQEIFNDVRDSTGGKCERRFTSYLSVKSSV